MTTSDNTPENQTEEVPIVLSEDEQRRFSDIQEYAMMFLEHTLYHADDIGEAVQMAWSAATVMESAHNSIHKFIRNGIPEDKDSDAAKADEQDKQDSKVLKLVIANSKGQGNIDPSKLN